jgi:peptidyl-prolyl cis-trans isomerase C
MTFARRSIAWAACSVLGIAVVAGLTADAVAAGRAARAARAPGRPDSNQVLVRIGKEVITRADVQRRLDALPEQFRSNYVTPEGRQQLLERLVEERVWLMAALSHGVAERPQVKQQIEQQRRDLLIRTYVNEVMAANPAVSDSEARSYYAAHQSDYQVPASITVRHIQARTEPDAKRAKQWAVRPGQDWTQLVKRFSTDTLTRANGGSLGTIMKGGAFGTLGTQPALAESAFALKEGAIGGPYKSDRGWHILRVDAAKPESARPFEQVKPLISRQLGAQRQQDFYKLKLDEARRSIGVAPDSNAIRSFVSQKKTAREMFNDAQALGTPDQRIEAYRKLLAEYPSSEVSPQAQFMIGFIYSEELKNYDEADKAFKTLLARWPKAELAASAQWMIEHMRTEEAPAFINLDADSAAAPQASPAGGTPRHVPPAPAKPAAGNKPQGQARTYRP